jgi:hypothetical protein
MNIFLDMHYIRKNARIYFQNFWRMSLPNRSSLNIRYSLIFLKLIIRAILIDYLPSFGVWQMGLGGNGEAGNNFYIDIVALNL